MVVRIKSGEVACDRSDYWVEVNLDLTTMKMEMPTISRHASGMWVAVIFLGNNRTLVPDTVPFVRGL